MNEDLVAQFARDMDHLYQIEKKLGRTHRRLKRMLTEHGPVEAARLLVNKKNTEGLRNLQEDGLLTISVEAHVSNPKYSSLFDEATVRRAGDKLAALREGRELPEEPEKVLVRELKKLAKAAGTELSVERIESDLAAYIDDLQQTATERSDRTASVPTLEIARGEERPL